MLPAGVRRFFRFGGARDIERDLDAELAFHFEARTRALMAAGMGEAAAREEALRLFGDLRVARAAIIRTDRGDAMRQSRRDWRGGWLFDVRSAVRALVRTPGLTAAVLVMLGLGIGGAAAMYGLLDRLLLRVGPGIVAPEQLRRLYVDEYDSYFEKARVVHPDFSEAQLRAIIAALPPGHAVAFIAHWRDRLGGPTGSRVPFGLVSGNAFALLGTTPALGRLIEPSDDTPTSSPAAVISFALWQRMYSGDRGIIGQPLRLGKLSYTVVGVAPRGFADLHPGRVDLWVPEAVGGEANVGRGWRDMLHGFEALVRVNADADVVPLAAAAQGAYRALPERQRHDSTASARAIFGSVLPYRRPDGFIDYLRLPLIVAGVAAILCLIAVANATNLLLLRSVQRRREIAVRLALGASRGRLVRGIVIESMILAVGGAAAAGMVAGWGGELLRKLIVRQDWQQGLLDGRVVVFAGLLGLVIGLVTGLVPGWQASGPDAIAALKAGVRAGSSRSWLRRGLLVTQAALTVILLAGLALYTRSFLKARAQDYGVAAERLINVSVRVAREDSLAEPGRLVALTADLAARLRRLPGVVAVSQSSLAPIYGYGGAALRAEGVERIAMDQSGPFYSEIDTAFLATTGLTVMRGRGFAGTDMTEFAPVALVNAAMARALWPGQEALGKCLYVGFAAESSATVCRQVVGVVSNYRNDLEEDQPMKNYYLPLGYHWLNGVQGGHSVVLRTSDPAERLLPQVLATLRERLPESEPEAVTAIGEITRRQIEPWRAGTTLFAMFAVLAVVLAMGGLYSMAAYGVAQRAHEFGVRVAVGADAADLVRLVLVTSLRPIAIGLLIGLGLTLYLVRFVGPLLYQTTPRDPLSMVAASLVLLAAAGVACAIPARTAARTDPRIALQAE